MGTGSFPGVKRPGRGVYHPYPSSAEVKERVELHLYFSFRPSWPVLGWSLPLLYRLHTTASPNTCSHTCHCPCVSTHNVHSAVIAVLPSYKPSWVRGLLLKITEFDRFAGTVTLRASLKVAGLYRKVQWHVLAYHSNKAVFHCNKVSDRINSNWCTKICNKSWRCVPTLDAAYNDETHTRLLPMERDTRTS